VKKKGENPLQFELKGRVHGGGEEEEEEEQQGVSWGGRGRERKKRVFACNDQNAPPTLFHLFLVQAELYLLSLV